MSAVESQVANLATCLAGTTRGAVRPVAPNVATETTTVSSGETRSDWCQPE